MSQPILLITLLWILAGVIGILLWKLFSLHRRSNQLLAREEFLNDRSNQQAQTISELRVENQRLLVQNSRLEALLEESNKQNRDQDFFMSSLQKELGEAFQGLSIEALSRNNQLFLDLAKSTFEKYQQSSEEVLEKKSTALSGMVHPLREALNQVNEKVTELERARHTAYGGVTELMRQISQAHQQLQQETANLSKAMRIPTTRGRWGEIQLRRVVELAGMVAHCDFSEQPYESNESGRFRPDLVVHLPNHRQVVVDAKAPLQAYLESVDASDEQMRLEKLREHAKQVRARIRDLSSKNYWNQFKPAPEFVVLFLPSESFFSAAVEQDHTLIEYGVEQQVILATPTTLISLLRAVSQGWKEEGVAENAQKICDLGKQLYDRMSVLINHFNELRKGLNRAVEAYNKTTISFEERITVTARRLKELHVGKSEELPDTATIDIHAREWSKPDCLGLEELDTELVVSSGTEKC